jgi:iron complex outermembrane receptor protein
MREISKVFFGYEGSLKKLPLLLLMMGLGVVNAQTYNIRGIVVDTADNPIVGVTIYLHETKSGATSNIEGWFEIKNVKSGTYHLHVKHLGFESISKNIKVINADVEINFHLKHATFEFEQILVESDMMRTGKIEQTQTIDVVNNDYLLKSSGVNLMQSLEKISGVTYISAGTGVAKPIIRGMGFNRIVTVDNGIVQDGQQWGSDHGLEIDQFGIGRVEILKGPASLVYGSDAMGGLLNLKPLPLPMQGKLAGAFVTSGQSNTNLYAASLMLEANKNGVFFRTRASVREYADYKVPADSFSFNRYVFPLYNNSLKNTAGKEEALSFTGGINKSWGVTQITASAFRQWAGFFPGAHGRPNINLLQNDGNNRNINYPYQYVEHLKISSNSSVLFKKNWLEIDLGVQQNLRKEKEELHTGVYLPSYKTADEALKLVLHVASSTIKYHLNVNEKWQHVFGLSAKRKENKIAGYSFLIPAFSVTEGGIFIFSEYRKSEKITFSGGVRADGGLTNISAYTDTIYSKELLPIFFMERSRSFNRSFSNLSTSFGFSWVTNAWFNIKFNIGSSFRYPTVAELASNGLHHGAFRYERGYANLKSERGYQTDLNVTFQKKQVMFRVTPFFNYFSNYIYLAPSGKYATAAEGGGQIYNYKQGNVFFTGYETDVDIHIHHRWHLGLIHDFVYNYNFSTSLPLPFSVPSSVTLEKEYTLVKEFKRFSDLYIGLDSRYVFAQNRVERNEKITPQYFLFNFSMGSTFLIGKQEVIFVFQVRNLLNQKYFNHLSFYRPLNLPEPGRNFTISLKIPFTIINSKPQ